MNWIMQHTAEIGIALTAVITAGVAVAKLTPSDKDDNFWSKAGQLLKKAKKFKLEDK